MNAIARTAASTGDALRIILLASLLTLAGFTTLAAQQVSEDASKEEATAVRMASHGPVTLEVANYNWLDMRIYAVRAGERFRLGTVTSFSREAFELPTHLQADISGVQILAAPIGSRRAHLSPHLIASAGDVLRLELEGDLDLSAFYVAR